MQLMDECEIFNTIAGEGAQRELAFLTGAQVALKLRQVLDKPDCSIAAAARLILAESLLAARVVAIANSVIYNRSGSEEEARSRIMTDAAEEFGSPSQALQF